MSSHHFVREGQEPALLIADALSADRIAPLLEWAPLVIVLDSALEDILLWGIKIDVVIGPAEAIDQLTLRLADQAPVKLFAYSQHEDPLSTALHFLIRTGERAVNITVQDIDHVPPRIGGFTGFITVGVLTKSARWSVISGKFEKWLPAGSALRFKDAVSPLTVNGVTLKTDVFVTPQDGLFRVESEGSFWLGEDL